MENEIWKDVIGFEGIYQVSSFGRVMSIDRMTIHKTYGTKVFKPSKNLKLQDNKGYKCIRFSFNGKGVSREVHRLVAIAFIPNPENKKCVNHIDGNPSNNHVSNLEWNTYSENNKHAYDNKLKVAKRLGENKCSKKVIDTVTGEIFTSVTEAAIARCLGGPNLSDKLNGKRRNNTNLVFLV